MGRISTFMDSDHAELDRIWERFISETEDTSKALKLFDDFESHLKKHMELEDTVLFPLFDQHTGLDSEVGPTVLARRDHSNIMKLMASVRAACDANNIKKIQQAAFHLQRALTAHRERENQMQYPVLDAVVQEGKWFDILKKIYA